MCKKAVPKRIENQEIKRLKFSRRSKSQMKEEINVPIWEKYMLTITEASEYFNIGISKMRQIVQENASADFILNNGVKVLIKKDKFEKFIDGIGSI